MKPLERLRSFDGQSISAASDRTGVRLITAPAGDALSARVASARRGSVRDNAAGAKLLRSKTEPQVAEEVLAQLPSHNTALLRMCFKETRSKLQLYRKTCPGSKLGCGVVFYSVHRSVRTVMRMSKLVDIFKQELAEGMRRRGGRSKKEALAHQVSCQEILRKLADGEAEAQSTQIEAQMEGMMNSFKADTQAFAKASEILTSCGDLKRTFSNIVNMCRANLIYAENLSDELAQKITSASSLVASLLGDLLRLQQRLEEMSFDGGGDSQRAGADIDIVTAVLMKLSKTITIADKKRVLVKIEDASFCEKRSQTFPEYSMSHDQAMEKEQQAFLKYMNTMQEKAAVPKLKPIEKRPLPFVADRSEHEAAAACDDPTLLSSWRGSAPVVADVLAKGGGAPGGALSYRSEESACSTSSGMPSCLDRTSQVSKYCSNYSSEDSSVSGGLPIQDADRLSGGKQSRKSTKGSTTWIGEQARIRRRDRNSTNASQSSGFMFSLETEDDSGNERVSMNSSIPEDALSPEPESPRVSSVSTRSFHGSLRRVNTQQMYPTPPADGPPSRRPQRIASRHSTAGRHLASIASFQTL